MTQKTPRKHQINALNAIDKSNEGIIHLPTGSGKTFIQALSISNNIDKGFKWLKKNGLKADIPVFTILAPRILLSDQLFNEIREILSSLNKDCQYLIVHSGNTKDSVNEWASSLPYRQIKSTTKKREIAKEYEKARQEKVPLIIIGTYDSAERIMEAEIPIYMTSCDEAQYLVSEEFHWISEENKDDVYTKQFQSHRKYYYTATLKETASDEGLGMNNSEEFGHILYEESPLKLIQAGEIIRPRMHLVDIGDEEGFIDEYARDSNAIVESFIEHRIHVKSGAKMLVVSKGSEHLNKIVSDKKIKDLLYTSPNLKIFDISSAYHPRINGEIVPRKEFLDQLQGLGDNDEAIIFHVRILTEGIDVPGITGIMPMNSMGLSTFLQTLGRASRLHGIDRTRLYAGEVKPEQTNLLVKPYAWVIIPIYGIIEEDARMRITDTIYALRDHGFRAAEDVVIKVSRGRALPVPLGGVNDTDKKAKKIFDIFIEIEHTIESREAADALAIEKYKTLQNIKKESVEDLINSFSLF